MTMNTAPSTTPRPGRPDPAGSRCLSTPPATSTRTTSSTRRHPPDDPYGYDHAYNTEEDQPTAGTRSDGSYQFITGEELATGSRFSANRNILSWDKKLEKVVKLPCGKDGEGKLTVKTPLKFDLNYFLTLNGGWSWKNFSPYIKKFETGLDGKFGIAPEVKLELHKEWKLDPDKFKKELFTFPASRSPS